VNTDVPRFDALILAGGRSSRLGGEPKQHLLFQGSTLLERSLAAASGAGRIVVVGPDPGPLPAGVSTCREEPAFAGPAAAIGAGLDALAASGGGGEYTLVLACDMPLSGDAVKALSLALAANARRPEAVLASADDGSPEGRIQPLAGFYRTDGLKRAVQVLAGTGGLANASVKALLASLDVQLVMVPAASTADVDTWDDAAALGVAGGGRNQDQDRRSSS
jgi:molybdopterin-guanine dinucleotide biosynthesis protein A